MKVDPIIAVQNVVKSSQWYQHVFGWKSRHGGNEFDVLVHSDGEVMLCLHRWGAHEHPTMQSDNSIGGNGLILYFRTPDITEVRARLKEMKHDVESEIAQSPNSGKQEFSLRDPDGYYLTIADYHEYMG